MEIYGRIDCVINNAGWHKCQVAFNPHEHVHNIDMRLDVLPVL